jgi:two-component system response regulator YesN
LPLLKKLTEYRIQEAKRLLLTQSLKSYEIAYEVGFKDPAYFSQLFKKIVGVSPKEYK